MDIELMRDRYNAVGYHSSIDYRNKSYHKNLENINPLIKSLINQGIRAIDLGCNAGRYSFFMEELGAEVTGIDFSDISLGVAREIGGDINSRCTFVEGNILDMDFKENSFDLALFPLNIVEFDYDDIEILCRSLKSILVSGGSFCITMQDGIERIKVGRDKGDSYDLSSGIHRVNHHIPDKGVYEYQTYFWTLAFAKHIIGRHFSLVKEVEIEENQYWLQFKNIK